MKNFREACQNWIPRVHKILLEKMLLEDFINFFFFGLSPKIFWIFGKFFSVGLPKLASRITEEKPDWKKSFRIKKFVPFHFWLWAVDFQAGGRKNRKCLQSCILCVHRKLLLENRFWEKKNFSVFGFSAVKARIFFWRSGMVVKLPVDISRRTSGENKIWRKKYNSNLFSNLREKVSKFCTKLFSRAVKGPFYLCRAGIPGKSFTERVSFSKFPRFWAERFGL